MAFGPDSSPFSPQVQLTRHKKAILAEADLLLTARKKSKALWAAIQIADYKKEGMLNEAATNVLYEKEKEVLRELLLVENCEEFVSLLDEFEDGFLTEDEQMLMFALIHERMQHNAKALCALHEYDKYRRMMHKVRKLEGDIARYQEILRKRIHNKELQAYHELGRDKLHHFRSTWSHKLSHFEHEKQLQLSELSSKHASEAQQLSRTTSLEVLNPKATARMRNLEVEEKLVAINERYNEAKKINSELKTLSTMERISMENSLKSTKSRLLKGLSVNQDRERRHLQLKLTSLSNHLRIERELQANRLRKEIKLHLNDITKQQQLGMKIAMKVGENREELRRSKMKAREMMAVMSESKAVVSGRKASMQSGIVLTGKVAGTQSARSSPVGLKAFLKDVTRFHIAPVQPNWEGPVLTANSTTKGPTKLEIELASKRIVKPVLKSVSSLYTSTLQPLVVPEDWEEPAN